MNENETKRNSDDINIKNSNTQENIKLRTDKNGNIISKKNSMRYKITFVDEVDNNKELAEIHRVESYKKYNSYDDEKRKN